MKKQLVKTKVKTSIAVGVALIAVAGVAAAAAISMAVLPPRLSVRLASTVTSATYAKGATAEMLGINLATSNGPVVVTSLTFHVLADDDASFATVENDLLAADFISDCSLLNASGTVVSGPEPINASGNLIFDGLAIRIGRDKSLAYKVSCDLANVTPASSDNDIFALAIDSESDVVASTTSGTALTGRTLDIGTTADAGVNLNGGTVAIIVMNNGGLEVSLDSSSPSSNIILGASAEISVGVWRFVATNEAFEINKMTLINSGDDEVADTVRLSCVNDSGDTEVSSGYLAGGTVEFAGLNCYVPKDSYAKVTALVDTNIVSSTGADSGSTLQLGFSDVNFEAIGLSSGASIGEGDLSTPEVNANEMVLYQTKPTISLVAVSPSGMAIPGRNEVLRFRVVADSRGEVDMHEFTFKINATDNADNGWNNCTSDIFTKFELYDLDDTSFSLSTMGGGISYLADGTRCTAVDPSGVEAPIAYWQIGEPTSSHPVEIAAGGVKTFALYFDTTGASSAEDDSVRIDLPLQSEMDGLGLFGLSWRGGSSDWANGTYIKNLPIYGGTITY